MFVVALERDYLFWRSFRIFYVKILLIAEHSDRYVGKIYKYVVCRMFRARTV